MNSTFSLTFSHVFELTSNYTEIPHKRTICVSLIHMKITRFKVQEDQIHFISSCIYLVKSIPALLVRRMHFVSVQKQNSLLLFRKTIAVAILKFYRRALFPLFSFIKGCFSPETFRNTLLSLILENSKF